VSALSRLNWYGHKRHLNWQHLGREQRSNVLSFRTPKKEMIAAAFPSIPSTRLSDGAYQTV
jgi:hypothetical protein